jgi:hypothetical protein
MAIGGMVALAPVGASAHFRLTAPAASYNQSSQGDPQKSAPCGQADNMLTPPGPAAVASNMVTAFAVGQTITITFNETVYHPGHYRVSLSTTGMAGLPADPAVTAGTMACGTAAIQSPPVLPVLADGMLQHTAAFSGAQQMMVTLPAGVTCTSNCVLQVTEFMSSHGAPCFYHHCANITIGAGTTGTGGAGGAGGATGAGGRGGAAGGGAAGGRGGAAGGNAGTGGNSAGSAGTTGVAGGAAGSGGSGGGDAGTGGGAAGVTGAAGAVAGSGGGTVITGTGGDAGSGGSGIGGSTTGSGGSGMTPPDDSGCACGLASASGGSAGGASVLLLTALGIARRRRRRGARRAP